MCLRLYGLVALAGSKHIRQDHAHMHCMSGKSHSRQSCTQTTFLMPLYSTIANEYFFCYPSTCATQTRKAPSQVPANGIVRFDTLHLSCTAPTVLRKQSKQNLTLSLTEGTGGGRSACMGISTLPAILSATEFAFSSSCKKHYSGKPVVTR